MKKISIIFASVGILTGLLAGCASTATQPANAAAASAQSAVSTSSAASTEVKKVVVAVASEEKPLSYTDDSGNLIGYEVDALKAIDQIIPEYEFDIQSVDADAEQVGLDAGKYALISEGLFKTKEREEKYLLPEENVGVSLITIVTRGKDTSINTLDDLIGKKVAPVSPNGGIFNLLTAYNKDHKDQIKILTQENLSTADKYQGLVSGKYDANVAPSLGFKETKDKLKLDLRQSAPVKVNNTYFVLGKTQTDLTAKVNEALKKIKADGTLSKLAVKYFEEDILKYKAS